jgi:serine O-acetyltransferase
LFEFIIVGNGITIGAGAVIVKDVEPGVTVAGNPAHVISRKEPGRLIYRKWSRTLNLNL